MSAFSAHPPERWISLKKKWLTVGDIAEGSFGFEG
jgi:hypothetical protein